MLEKHEKLLTYFLCSDFISEAWLVGKEPSVGQMKTYSKLK